MWAAGGRALVPRDMNIDTRLAPLLPPIYDTASTDGDDVRLTGAGKGSGQGGVKGVKAADENNDHDGNHSADAQRPTFSTQVNKTGGQGPEQGQGHLSSSLTVCSSRGSISRQTSAVSVTESTAAETQMREEGHWEV
ncbi:hypothetical protein V1264_007830 [Littorina saxatilis]|uniref:Uncharacterized protein n=1 Tax=Littorina saxatilis TaxID=31220 RepID=A0AAN9AVK4_9CAEN